MWNSARISHVNWSQLTQATGTNYWTINLSPLKVDKFQTVFCSDLSITLWKCWHWKIHSFRYCVDCEVDNHPLTNWQTGGDLNWDQDVWDWTMLLYGCSNLSKESKTFFNLSTYFRPLLFKIKSIFRWTGVELFLAFKRICSYFDMNPIIGSPVMLHRGVSGCHMRDIPGHDVFFMVNNNALLDERKRKFIE